MGCAQTGTGKTAAFAIPLLARMLQGTDNRPALIICPTRELAEQIVEVLRQLTVKAQNQRIAFVIGGRGMAPQTDALKRKPSFVVGTPGRLIDHMEQKNFDFSTFGSVVIDEADRLLDMGFGPQLNRIFARLAPQRQTLLFSATFPEEIKAIAGRYLTNPKSVSVGSETRPVEKIRQTVVNVTAENKNDRLIEEVRRNEGSMIIFTRTKGRTEKIAKLLAREGHAVARIHGDRSQNQRQEAIAGLKSGQFRILVATDIAARGIDIPQLQHVINFDLPMVPEDFIHRIGRTGRAGADGHAMAFVTPEDHDQWTRIYRLMHGKNAKVAPHPHGPARPQPAKNHGSAKNAQAKTTQPQRRHDKRSHGTRSPSKNSQAKRSAASGSAARGAQDKTQRSEMARPVQPKNTPRQSHTSHTESSNKQGPKPFPKHSPKHTSKHAVEPSNKPAKPSKSPGAGKVSSALKSLGRAMGLRNKT
jgi:superfamily II DNA/RNA helicase